MNTQRLRWTILSTLLAASGCAAPPPPAPPAPPPIVADGSYTATIALTSMAPGFQKIWCDTAPTAKFTVVNNSFRYAMPHPGMPGNPTPVYEIKINDNGSFRTENEAGVMLGQLDGTTITAKVNGTVCYYDFTAQRG